MLLPRTLFAAAVLARRLQCYLGPRWTSLALIDQFYRSRFRFCTSLLHLICMFSHSFTSYIHLSDACLLSEVTFTLLLGDTINKLNSPYPLWAVVYMMNPLNFRRNGPLSFVGRLAELLISIANHSPFWITGSDRDFVLGMKKTKKCDLPSTLRHAMPPLGAA